MYDNTKYIHRHTNLSTKKDNLFKFCMALPYNLVFSTGFDLVSKEWNRSILSDKRYNYCFCPCSCKMSKWHVQFELPNVICGKNKKSTPVGLLDHLGSHDDIYHRAVKFYLKNLYSEVLGDKKPARKASGGIKWEKNVWSK